MKPQDAEKEFRAFLLRRGTSLERLDAVVGLDAMVAFYREVRGQGLRFEHDEDMLLFQWGCYEQSDGVAFDLDITRQLIFESQRKAASGSCTCHFISIRPMSCARLGAATDGASLSMHYPSSRISLRVIRR